MSTTMVYSETFPDRKPLDTAGDRWAPSQVSLDRKFTIWQSPDKVGVAESVLRSGVFKNKVRWYKWGTHRAWGLRRTSSGHPMPYFSYRAESLRNNDAWGHGKPTMVFDAMENPEQVSAGFYEAYMRALRESFSVKTMFDVYPMADEFGIWKYTGIANNLRVGMREKSIEDMVTVLFGKGRAGRDWYDAVKNTDPYITALAHQARGLAKDSEVLGFLKNNNFDEEMAVGFQPHTPRIRPLFRVMDVTTPSALMNSTLDLDGINSVRNLCGEGRNIKDMVNRLKSKKHPTKATDWTELNNAVWRSYF